MVESRTGSVEFEGVSDARSRRVREVFVCSECGTTLEILDTHEPNRPQARCDKHPTTMPVDAESYLKLHPRKKNEDNTST